MALGVSQGHDGNEAAEVEAVGGGIEAHIHGARGFREVGVEVVAGDGIQEAAPTEFIEKGV